MTATSTLVTVKEQGWRMGFANLLRNENFDWWRSRRWLNQACLWLLIVNGFVVINLFILPAIILPDEDVASMMDPVSEGIRALFQLGATALAIGTIILAQGKVIGERQAGIAAWILSKPVARPAYFLSKIVALSIRIFAIMIGFQSAVAYGLLWFANGEPLPLLPFLLSAVGLTLHTFFYLALTLMLGVFVKTRIQVLGITMGSLFGGMLLSSLVSQLGLITPWSLPNILPVLALQIPLPLTNLLAPILMTTIWSIIFVVAALWKLSRLEF